MKMKKIIAVSLFLMVFFAGCKNFPDTEGYDLYRGTVDRLVVWSADSSFSTSVLVYKPYEYCETCSDSLPAIYIFSPFDMDAEELTSIYPIFDMFDRMLSARVIPPMIVVVVDGINEANDGAFADNYENFILNDVFESVAENYHVYRDSVYNGVIGIGPMAGYEALKLYFEHTYMLGCAAAHSPMVEPLDFVRNYLLNQALFENSGRLPNPPINPEMFPSFEKLLTLGLMISPKTAPFDSFDLSNEFPIKQLDDTLWIGAVLPWDTLGTEVADSELLSLWENSSLLSIASSVIENIEDTSTVWIDLGVDDNPVLAQPINALVDTLNSYEKRPVFELYEHDVADPDSVVPVRWKNYLLVRINYSIGHVLKVMWFR